MKKKFFKNPQIYITGKFKKAINFDKNNIYIKFEIKYGDNYNLIQGKEIQESPLYISDDSNEVSIDYPFFYHLSSNSIRGWPKFLFQIWEEDSYDNTNILGYGSLSIPFKPGNYELTVDTWNIKDAKDTNYLKELEYKDVVINTASRYGFKTTTSGKLVLDLNVVVQDFEQHGIQM